MKGSSDNTDSVFENWRINMHLNKSPVSDYLFSIFVAIITKLKPFKLHFFIV